MGQVKKYGLRKGDAVHGSIRAPREGDRRNQRQKFVPLQAIDSINGQALKKRSTVRSSPSSRRCTRRSV